MYSDVMWLNRLIEHKTTTTLTLDDTVLDVALSVGHVHGDRLDVRHVLELDTACKHKTNTVRKTVGKKSSI